MANFKKPSKKTAIIAIVAVLILLAVAITGTVVFLKDRGSTEAADFGTEQVDRRETTNNEQTPSAGQTGEEQQTTPNEATEATTQSETQTGTAETTTGTTTGTTTTGTGTSTGTTTGTTTTTDNIQESTITRNETVITERPWETQDVTWSPIEIESKLALADISTSRDDITKVKTAKIATGKNIVAEGEEISYQITVTNNSESKTLNGIEVKDKIPANTTYVEKSVTNDGEPVTNENQVVIGIRWNVDLLPKETKTLSFKVRVNTGAKTVGEIENTATVNGETTNKEKTAIITKSKTAKVNGVEGATARVGDIITYTISVENFSKDIKGKAFIQDTELKNLTSGEKPILTLTDKDGNALEGKEIAEQLMEGKTVDVEPGKTEFTFNARVLRVAGAIENSVIISDPTNPIDPTDPTDPIIPEEPSAKVETADLTVLKEVENEKDEYKLGETVTYKVTVTNNGSTTLTNIKVTDQLQGVKLVSDSDVIETLEPQESDFVEYEYTIQEKDLGTATEQGAVNNVATAKASDGTTNSGSETVVTEKENPKYELRKVSEIKEKGDGNTSNLAEVGDTVKYTIYIKNTGNITLTGVKVEDTTMNKSATVASIAPNSEEQIALTFEHEVVVEDIQLKEVDGAKVAYIYNAVAGEWTDPTDPERTVTTDTDNEQEARKDFNYTVKYYFDNELRYTENQPAEGTVELGTVINANQVDTETHKDVGYKIDTSKGTDENGIVGAPLTISADKNENVINVYYVKDLDLKKDLTYTVEYYLNGNKDASKTQTVTEQVWVNSTVNTLTVNKAGINTTDAFGIGYKFVSTDPSTIPDTIATGSTIKVYYVDDLDVKKDLTYTVEYYLNGNKDASKTTTVTKQVWVNSTENILTVNKDGINTTDAFGIGYKFVSTDPATIPDTIATGSTIKVYYVDDLAQKKELTYTVEYYLDGSKDTSKTTTVTEKVWVNSTVNTLTVKKDEINTTDKFGASAKFVSTDPATIPTTVTTGAIIKVYYVTRPDPEIRFTKSALNESKNTIANIVYNPDGANTFYYRLKLENTVEGSYPATIAGPRTVTDILPSGIELYIPTEADEANLKAQGITWNVERDENGEITKTTITWVATEIGYGEEAVKVDIPVKVVEKAFKEAEEEQDPEQTVFSDVTPLAPTSGSGYGSKDTKNTMDLYIRFAAPVSGNTGYLYAGTTTGASSGMPTSGNNEKFVTNNGITYNDSTINSYLQSSNKDNIDTMLDALVDANNSNGTMKNYVSGGKLPTRDDISEYLQDNYGLTLTDSQVVLWYKVVYAGGELNCSRTYPIQYSDGTIERKTVKISACTYHLDGMIIDIKSLENKIPEGAQVNVTNTATLVGISGNDDITSSAQVSLYYKQMPVSATSSANLLSMALAGIESEEINEENLDNIVKEVEAKDRSNSVNVIDTTTANNEADKENVSNTETTTPVNNESIDSTTSTNTDTDNSTTTGDVTNQTEESGNETNSENINNKEETTINSVTEKSATTVDTETATN